MFVHLDRLRPFARPWCDPCPWWGVTPPATTAALPRGQHGSSADLPLLELASVPALLASQVLCCRRSPFDPLTWRTRLGTRLMGCKAHRAPALPYGQTYGCGTEPKTVSVADAFPHLLAIVGEPMIVGCLGFAMPSYQSRVRDGGLLGRWLPRTPRPCPHRA